MIFSHAFTTITLAGGELVRTTDTAFGASDFTANKPDGTALLHLHLDQQQAAQWAAVLTEYAKEPTP